MGSCNKPKKKEILELLNVAYDMLKGTNRMEKYITNVRITTLVWLDDENLYKEINDLFYKYKDSDIPIFNKISEYYGYTIQ